MIQRDPSIILEKELDHFTGMIQAFANDNHFEHFNKSNLSAVLHKFIKTGRVDHTILNTRKETPIDKFHKDKESKDGD